MPGLRGEVAVARRAAILAAAGALALAGCVQTRQVADVMAANADKIAEYRSGKDKLFGFFVGQTMKAMAGKANPQVVNELLKKALG